ncbi:DUF692 domain-containing protein [Dermacoccus nishinomiyaensis]|nr:DUF692 domain-containing protein [Dermacoccus nishinomiyaensis]NHC30849.1 DUF692 domain-containing protein [Dermacoccus nishinomiyaensis]
MTSRHTCRCGIMRDMSITMSAAAQPAPATSMPAGVGIGWRPEIADVLAAHALLLLDIANVYANARNHGGNPLETALAMPVERLAYMHVAGGVENDGIYHDTHAAAVNPEVLHLISELSRLTGLPAAMLELDGDYPPAEELLTELDAIADAAGMPRVTAAQ